MQDSIYHKKRGEFKQFIQRIPDRTMTVRDVIGTWREFRCLYKEFKDMTIQQLVDSSNLIAELRNALRDGMPPEAKFQLEYNKEERYQELIENISDSYSINIEKAEAKIVTGHYKDISSEREFNYCLEVVIAPRSDIGDEGAGKIDIIGNINSSTGVDGGANYFDGYYTWDRKHNIISANDLRGILSECGFSTSTYMSKRRVPSVLYINLETPCPDWLGGAGKTHIDTKPYSEDIAKTVSTLGYKMPSYHGKGYGSNDYYGDNEKSAISYLEDFLRQRYYEIRTNPSLRKMDRLTQSGVWYRIRPIMIDGHFEPKQTWGKTRAYLTSEIDKKCKELFGDNVEREDLGIVAKARGMMLYNDQVYPIDIDSFEELGKKGVFILVIEKEGIADIFKDVARDSGVALVHTGGKFTKYVKTFIEDAKVPIATLTDYDADGIDISAETTSVTDRIGIDMDIIEWLQVNGYPDLRRENVEEEYSPRVEPDNEYLKHHRIELDSIAEKVEDEIFWKYIKYKIEKQQEEDGFDYNNVIDDPETETLYPTAMKDLISKLDLYIEEITRPEQEAIHGEQSAVNELILIEDKNKENNTRLENIVANDEDMQKQIVPIIQKVSEQLSNVLDDE